MKRDSIKIILVVGARPNFMKMAPLYQQIERYNSTNAANPINTFIVHTGQHYDYEMSQAFFEDLKLPKPHYFLGIGSGTHTEQTAKTMIEFEKVLLKEKPDLVTVFGDVNSTLACALTTVKFKFSARSPILCHVEAGLRSFDETMPEETNRKLTDAISDLLFTPSKDGNENLIKEGTNPNKIHLVGNIMIDSLIVILKRINKSYEDKILQKYNLKRKDYALITLHRPSNVDDKESLEKILYFLNNLSQRIPVVFPMHPRTKKNIDKFGINIIYNKKFNILEPLRYKEFITLEKNSKLILTDSGGIQEETTYLNIPCLALRPNTERPITITKGTNKLATMKNIGEKIELILSEKWKNGEIPELWDGKTAGRIVKILEHFFAPHSLTPIR